METLNSLCFIALVQRIRLPVNIFCGSYFSIGKSMQTISRANGLTAISILEANQYRTDKRLHSLYQLMHSKIIKQMSEVGLDRAEYLFLFVLIFTNSDICGSELSGQGRNLLYAKSVEYTRKLHELLQCKFGIFAGAQRLAALMNLLQMVNKMPHLIYECTYVPYGIFLSTKRKSADRNYPKSFHSNHEHRQIEPQQYL